MKLYHKKFLIYGNCMIRSFGQPGYEKISMKLLFRGKTLCSDERKCDETLLLTEILRL